MAIISCPNCGNSISDKANQCPKCGIYLQKYAQQTSNKNIDMSGLEWYMWALFLCVGFLIPLIYYFVKKNNAPVRAKNALTCVWIDFAIWILVLILS